MYGTSAGVAALTPRYANGTADFATNDRPTKAQVETFLAQMSNLLDAIMADVGFTTPVTDADVISILTMFVQDEVAAIVEGINGSGRFGPTTKAPKKGRYQMIFDDIQAFVYETASGLERMGAARTGEINILYRSTDEAGLTTSPLFARTDFGETYKDRS